MSREIRVDGCTRPIVVDDEDYEFFSKYHYTVQVRMVYYAARRLLGCPKGMEIDHINNDPFDNRKENLRVVTKQENVQNKRYRRSNAG